MFLFSLFQMFLCLFKSRIIYVKKEKQSSKYVFYYQGAEGRGVYRSLLWIHYPEQSDDWES